jgi:CRP-like cAMP-binding protein
MFATTIADYLGLAIKTVSRTMSQFASEASIGLPSSRRIVLRNVAPCAS